MTKARLIAAALLLTLPLAACKKAEPPKQAQAGGEILPGSVSDAMLPMDTVTSQPPLAPREVKSEPKAKDVASGAPDKPDVGAPAIEAKPVAGAEPEG